MNSPPSLPINDELDHMRNQFEQLKLAKNNEVNEIRQALTSAEFEKSQDIRKLENDNLELRDKISNLQAKNDSLNKEVNLLKPYRTKTNQELFEKDDVITNLESRLSKALTAHSEEVRELKSQLFQKESQLKEFVVDDDCIKADHLKEILKLKSKYESQLKMLKEDSELAYDIVKKDLERKEREVKTLKSTLSVQQDQIDTNRGKYETEIVKLRNMSMAAIEDKKSLINLQELESQNEILNAENKRLQRQVQSVKNLYFKQTDRDREQELLQKISELTLQNEKLAIEYQESTSKVHTQINQFKRQIIILEQDKEDLENQVRETLGRQTRHSENLNTSVKSKLDKSLLHHHQVNKLKDRIDSLERENHTLETQN